MLINQRDIYEAEPPLLIVLGDKSWRVARRICPHPDGVAYLQIASYYVDGTNGDYRLSSTKPGSLDILPVPAKPPSMQE